MKSFKSLLGALALIFSASQAGAVVYTTDTFLFSANLGNSGDATEESALEAFLGFAVTQNFKTNTPQPELVALQTGVDQWTINVSPATPGYFMIKFGTGGTGATADHFYFRNIGELDKLVWTNDQVQFLTGGSCGAKNDNACNIGRLSHYAGYTGSTTGGGGGGNVPEPASLSLMGAALVGLAMSRRRRK